jgi:hypothetical protein
VDRLLVHVRAVRRAEVLHDGLAGLRRHARMAARGLRVLVQVQRKVRLAADVDHRLERHLPPGVGSFDDLENQVGHLRRPPVERAQLIAG